MLGDFEIRSDTIRFAVGQAKGYHRPDFTDAWARYCGPIRIRRDWLDEWMEEGAA